MFASESESLWLQVIAFGQEGEMVVLDRTKVTIGHSSVLGVSCDSSGHISVLRKSIITSFNPKKPTYYRNGRHLDSVQG